MARNGLRAPDSYVADFAAFQGELPPEPEAVGDLRRRAFERFAELGFPTPRQEEWRFTNVAPIADKPFVRAARVAPGATSDTVRRHSLEGTKRLVFVNGRYQPELSALPDLPPGAVAGSLSDALAQAPEIVTTHLGRYARFVNHPFVALNTAFMRDGAFVFMPRGTELEAPLHLLFIGTAPDGPTVAYPRNLIVAGEGSRLAVVESYVGQGSGSYFTCAVTEFVAGPNAAVDHCKLQEESTAASHVATMHVRLEGDSQFTSHSVSTGGALVRHDVNTDLDAEGINCTLNGLYMVSGRQHVDTHMLVRHLKPHCNSHELYKGILDGQSRAVFNGRIYVHPGAQKTDAIQSNRNLLLSQGALVNSNPQLEIFADDVRCTHGSTVGQLDEEAVFYLRSRGIGDEAARSLLVHAFAGEIIQGIGIAPVRRRLEGFLSSRLPGSDGVRQFM